MSEWHDFELGDVLTLQRGFDITRTSQRSGSIPVVSSSGINSYHDEAMVQGPGVVIGRKGSLGTCFFLNQPFWPHDTTLWVKDFKGNDPHFCYFLLKSLDLAKFDVGAANPTLNRNHVHLLRIRCPSLAIQRRIASILGAYDDLIEVNRRRIALLEEMARRLFEEWFVRFRFPGHEGHVIIETPDGPLPNRWHRRTIGELSVYLSRGIAPKYDETAPTLVVSQKCIRDQRLSLDPARKQSRTAPREKLVAPGDVLINSTGVGTLGRVAQAESVPDGLTVDTHVTIVRPREQLDRDFFGLALLRLEPLFERMGAGATGQTELNRGRIAEVVVAVPPENLQTRFGHHARPLRLLAYQLARQNDLLAASRDLLLPRLISGELSINTVERELEAVA